MNYNINTELYTSIATVAKGLNASPEAVVQGYRDAAFSAFYALDFNRIQLIRFVRECLAVRAPDVKGRDQYHLAVEILEQEKLG